MGVALLESGRVSIDVSVFESFVLSKRINTTAIACCVSRDEVRINQDVYIPCIKSVMCMYSEKAVLTVLAHVFQIDPDTKKKWLPTSTASVKVSYYHDPTRKTYRIIAIEDKKVFTHTHMAQLLLVVYTAFSLSLTALLLLT